MTGASMATLTLKVDATHASLLEQLAGAYEMDLKTMAEHLLIQAIYEMDIMLTGDEAAQRMYLIAADPVGTA